MENRNLCSPLIMNEHDAIIYCARHVCISCLGLIQPYKWDEGRFIIQCARCGKTLKEGDGVRKEAVDRIMYNKSIGEKQMEDDKPRMSAEQAIRDLGF